MVVYICFCFSTWKNHNVKIVDVSAQLSGFRDIYIIKSSRCTSNKWIDLFDIELVGKTCLLRRMKDFFYKVQLQNIDIWWYYAKK